MLCYIMQNKKYDSDIYWSSNLTDELAMYYEGGFLQGLVSNVLKGRQFK